MKTKKYNSWEEILKEEGVVFFVGQGLKVERCAIKDGRWKIEFEQYDNKITGGRICVECGYNEKGRRLTITYDYDRDNKIWKYWLCSDDICFSEEEALLKVSQSRVSTITKLQREVEEAVKKILEEKKRIEKLNNKLSTITAEVVYEE